MKIIIHIGTHKTGTTAIQNFCYKNNILLNNEGFFYAGPVTNNLLTQHSELAQFLRENNSEVLESFFVQNISSAKKLNCHSLILSAENLCHMGPTAIERLYDYTKEHEVVIKIYVRNIYDYVMSALSQRVKVMHTLMEGPEPISPIMKSINYSIILNRWEKVYGKTAVQVDSFDLHKHDMITHFLESLDLDTSPLNIPKKREVADPKQNINPDITTLSFMALSGLIHKKKDLRTFMKKYGKSFGQSERLISPFQVRISEMIVNKANHTYDHPKLKAFKDILLKRPEHNNTDERTQEYLSNMEKFIFSLRMKRLSFYEKLKLLLGIN
ncbi:hypothetical protein QGN29_02200 [Temperatibacter marinus]|uniref:Sulfotransferase domain-containing protein n=1 Tax=Temperatibacter marinus TaxID=1456591 RepID=A0AA52EGD2_9PROT|nr:hypothetical protein [Temperatibacter marinus]WND03178.1 hypothetical protein QGN29_02200 [Temperatibacter marinus]